MHSHSAHAMPSSRAASVERKSLMATVSSASPALSTTPPTGRRDPFASTLLSMQPEVSSSPSGSLSAAAARAVAGDKAYRITEWMIRQHEESIENPYSTGISVLIMVPWNRRDCDGYMGYIGHASEVLGDSFRRNNQCRANRSHPAVLGKDLALATHPRGRGVKSCNTWAFIQR